MWLLKKLVDWFEDLLWTQAVNDVSETPNIILIMHIRTQNFPKKSIVPM